MPQIRKPKQLSLFGKRHPTIERTDFEKLEAKKAEEIKKAEDQKTAKLKKRQDLLKPKEISETYAAFQKALDILTAIDTEIKSVDQSKINMQSQLRTADDYERRELYDAINSLKPDLSRILPKKGTIEYTFYRIIEDLVRDSKFNEIKKDYEHNHNFRYGPLVLTAKSLDNLIRYSLNHRLLTGRLNTKISRLLKFLKAFNYSI